MAKRKLYTKSKSQGVKCPWCGRQKCVVKLDNYTYDCTWCKRLFGHKGNCMKQPELVAAVNELTKATIRLNERMDAMMQLVAEMQILYELLKSKAEKAEKCAQMPQPYTPVYQPPQPWQTIPPNTDWRPTYTYKIGKDTDTSTCTWSVELYGNGQ